MGRTRYGSGWTTAFWLGEIVEGPSGESPLIRAAPQKFLSLPLALSLIIVVYRLERLGLCLVSGTPLSRRGVDPPCFPGTGASLVFLSPIRAYLLVVR